MIDIKGSTEEYIGFVKNSLDKMLEYSEGIIFKEINFDFLDGNLNLNELKFDNGIYIISIQNLDVVSNKEICQLVSELKNSHPNYKFPKINGKNCSDEKNNILYIGKSKGRLHSRISGHLGNGSPSTFALHLSQWKQNERLKKVKLTLQYAFLNMDDEDIESDILELLETALHRKYKPVLGRTGH